MYNNYEKEIQTMKDNYGYERTANIAVRLSEQEKEAIKEAAAKAGVSISIFIRNAIEAYMKGDSKQ